MRAHIKKHKKKDQIQKRETMSPIILSLSIFLLTLIALLYRHGRKPPLPPGPWPVPVIGSLHALTALPHRGLRDLSLKYGPIMSLRLGRVLTVVASSPRAAELILRTHDTVFASRPFLQVSRELSYGRKGMAFAEYGAYWRNMRKLCTLNLLTAAKADSFRGLRTEVVAAALADLRASAAAREIVDVGRVVGDVIAEVSCRMILGVSLFENRDDLKQLVHETMFFCGTFNVADYVPYLSPFDLQGYTRQMKKLSKRIDEVLEKIISDHEQLVPKFEAHHHKDFVDVLLSLMNQPINPQDDHAFIIERTNIKAILLDIIVAAFDTSAVSIEWTLSELLKNPKVMKTLQEEVESVASLDRLVEESDLANLSYLDMVIKESFRLHPIGPLLVPRESMEDIIIDGYLIPKKSRVLVNSWAIGRDRNVWSENVDEFYPERFVDKKIDLHGRDFELLPFGSGRRGCPGINMGLINVRFMVAQLVHCFNWELPSGVEPKDIDMDEKFALSVGRANPLLAIPKYRLHDKTL